MDAVIDKTASMGELHLPMGSLEQAISPRLSARRWDAPLRITGSGTRELTKNAR